ncbi:MAG: MBL fold metallo-hydrolase, partial [Imperialibacter sp.]
MLKIKAFAFNPFQENTYVLHDETKECVIIDPGCFDTSEKLELTDFIASNGLRPVKLLNTHCHIDHVLGNAYCKRNFGIELYAHKKDEPVLRAVKAYASNYGFAGYE